MGKTQNSGEPSQKILQKTIEGPFRKSQKFQFKPLYTSLEGHAETVNGSPLRKQLGNNWRVSKQSMLVPYKLWF